MEKSTRSGITSMCSGTRVNSAWVVLCLIFIVANYMYYLNLSQYAPGRESAPLPKAHGGKSDDSGKSKDRSMYKCPQNGAPIVDETTISAITRADSSYCKRLFLSIQCLNMEGSLIKPKVVGDPNFSRERYFEKHTFTNENWTFPRKKSEVDDLRIHSQGWPDNSYYTLLCPRLSQDVEDLFGKKSSDLANNYFTCRRRPRILYVLLVTEVTERIFLRLLNALDDPENLFVIHVDTKYSTTYEKLAKFIRIATKKDLLQTRTLKLSKVRFNSYWGGYSFVLAMHAAILEMIDLKWDFVINLSLSDYPLNSQNALKELLALHPQSNFMASGRHTSIIQGIFRDKEGLDCLYDNAKTCDTLLSSRGLGPQKTFLNGQGYFHNFVECENRLWNVGVRKVPRDVIIDGGSDWFIFSKTFANFLVKDLKLSQTLFHNEYRYSVTGNKKEPFTITPANPYLDSIHSVFRYSLHAAESFFHSVLLNHPYFSGTYVNGNLRFISWRRKNCNCKDREKFADWCSCSPTFINNMDIANVTTFLSVSFVMVFKRAIFLNDESSSNCFV